MVHGWPLPFCGVDRGVLLWGVMPPRQARGQPLHPIYALPAVQPWVEPSAHTLMPAVRVREPPVDDRGNAFPRDRRKEVWDGSQKAVEVPEVHLDRVCATDGGEERLDARELLDLAREVAGAVLDVVAPGRVGDPVGHAGEHERSRVHIAPRRCGRCAWRAGRPGAIPPPRVPDEPAAGSRTVPAAALRNLRRDSIARSRSTSAGVTASRARSSGTATAASHPPGPVRRTRTGARTWCRSPRSDRWRTAPARRSSRGPP